ncbi:MAG: phage holin family protein [Frankiaceae bacterium]|nr:phage holin family protein [Frankiaceae bacterium]
MDSTRNAADERSLGELVASATRDLSRLVHQEVELAKTEIKKEVKAAGAGAGLFGGAGFAGVLALVFLSISAAYGISWLGIGLGWGFFIVGLVYLVLAAVLALSGKKKISQVGPPERTITTVKDDIAWAKNPTSTEAAKASAHR